MTATASESGRGPVGTEPTPLSLVDLLAVVMRRRRAISGAALVGFIFGAAYGLLGTRYYASGATFVPQAPGADASSGGSLALAASQFGIRMPTSGAGWGAPIYVEVIYSRSLLAPIAMDSLVVAEQGGRRIAVADLLKVKERDLAKREEKTVRALRDVISASENKRLGAVQLSVSTEWPSVSFALAQRLLADVNRFNLVKRQSQAGAERKFAEAQAKEAQQALEVAEERMRTFLEQNRVVGSPALLYQRERIQREITVRQQTYMSLLQSFSEARLREVRDTPVITLLETPMLPAMGDASHTALKAIGGALVCALLATMFALAAETGGATGGGLWQVLRQMLGSPASRA